MPFFYIANIASAGLPPDARLVASDKHLGLDPGHHVALVVLLRSKVLPVFEIWFLANKSATLIRVVGTNAFSTGFFLELPIVLS